MKLMDMVSSSGSSASDNDNELPNEPLLKKVVYLCMPQIVPQKTKISKVSWESIPKSPYSEGLQSGHVFYIS